MSIRIGIVGAGNISETHARAAQAIPGVEIAAVHGDNREKAARLAERFGATAYDDYQRFLAHTPLDIVAIGSPSGCHAGQGIAAARRGLHVLVEKPLDITTERVDALIDAAGKAGVKLGVFFQDRLRPAVAQIKSLIDTGRLGSPVLITGHVKWHRPPEYYATSRWRGTWTLDGGGALMNQGIHTVDLMQWLFGPVERVYGMTATRLHEIQVEDTAAAVIQFASGAIGTIEAATSAFPGFARRLEVTGTEGTAILEHDRLDRVDLRSGERVACAEAGDTTASATTAVVSDASAHQRVLEDFIRAIETNGRPACDGAEGRRSVALVQAIYESARTNSAVKLGS